MSKIKEIIYIMLMKLFQLFPINKNKIVVVNFYGKGYGDSPKYIVEELLKRKDEYKIIWLLNDLNSIMPKDINKVKYKSIRAIYELATAKIWIDNARKRKYVSKRKNQFYIQTWHGGIGLKKIEKDAEDKLTKEYIEAAKNDSKMIDLIISNCDYRTNLYKNSFWYSGNIFEDGLPRNDIFFNEKLKKDIKNKIISKYNIKDNLKIVLYAPTFRNNYNVFDNFDFEKFESDAINTILLVKAHPDAKCEVGKHKNIIDVSKYPDIQELIIACDCFISDYSSCLFDAMICGKPVYLYAPDYNNYVDERGFTFKYKELPFSISYNMDELINNINSEKHKELDEKLELFKNEVNIKDNGQASKKIATIINEVINGGIINEKI